MDDLLTALNPAQRAAVEHGSGPLLVLAGAGSGKTRVLTHRIAHLIRDHRVPPGAILAITFTNRAAGEMRERLGPLVGPAASSIWASTFHSACARILRRESERVGYERSFTILDADDQLRMLRACYAEEEIDTKRYPPRGMHSAISDAKNRLLTPDDLREAATTFTDEKLVQLYARYQDRLRANQSMDFDDLLMLTVQLLESDDQARGYYQRRFEQVLVDEYQDTNHAQYRLVRVLGEPSRNVCVVGDDDQGIYSWRGAEVRNILDFENDYPEARVVLLEENYRSTGLILKAANAVVAKNTGRHEKRLHTGLGDGEPVRVMLCRDEQEEARAVLGEVERALDAGDSLDDVAVFYRTNAQSRVIEDALNRARIDYQVIGGPRFYERAEIRDVLAWLRAAVNPADTSSLGRAFGAPKRGLGPGCLARLLEYAQREGSPVGEVLDQAELVDGLRPKQREELTRMAGLLAHVRQLDSAAAGVDEMIEAVLERSGMRDVLTAEDTFEAQGRLENLDELVRLAAEADVDTGEVEGLAAFLEQVSLQADADTVVDDRGKVTLMTIHNAKGLEFDRVVITGLEEQLFPHQRSETPEAVEEERRLCYVGITRARKHLLLTHAESRALYGGRDYRLPSRFLGELPTDAISEVGGRRGFGTLAPSVASAAVVSEPDYETGDAVLHTTFGEGVITGIEQGGDLVRVRFRDDGSERRLMAGAAPMRKVEG
ncbi:MAG: UvrD-helicase domain-containing protein [Thermoleophilia bacterium]|nr:UvrD-helicase domain-containing protein [Thermoleophilia bacterium]MDH3724621.1 UvrD-helicase domain-containing protein [Thermoleophilia bacterium]